MKAASTPTVASVLSAKSTARVVVNAADGHVAGKLKGSEEPVAHDGITIEDHEAFLRTAQQRAQELTKRARASAAALARRSEITTEVAPRTTPSREPSTTVRGPSWPSSASSSGPRKTGSHTSPARPAMPAADSARPPLTQRSSGGRAGYRRFSASDADLVPTPARQPGASHRRHSEPVPDSEEAISSYLMNAKLRTKDLLEKMALEADRSATSTSAGGSCGGSAATPATPVRAAAAPPHTPTPRRTPLAEGANPRDETRAPAVASPGSPREWLVRHRCRTNQLLDGLREAINYADIASA